MWVLPLLLLVESPAAESVHLERNAVYRELQEHGLSLVEGGQIALPKPFLSDGLEATAQRKLIEGLGGRRYPWERLTRESTVAPQIIHIDEKKLPNSDTKARVVDIYFVAYGDLDAIAKSGNLTQPDQSNNKQWKEITAEELSAKKIIVENPALESYGYLSNDLIEKVRVSGVLRTAWSQTEDSILATAVLDPRFDQDVDYPNRWQPLARGRNGQEAGAASEYHGAGGYTKITKLKEPQGALFVESHLVFAEPHGWFNGANLLSSKLPAVIQNEVRSSRREFLEASKK